jgi:type IV pilus assembly protein PilX
MRVRQINGFLVRQRGAALVICMIMLLIMTLGAVTSMRLSNSQLVITNSFQNEQEAFVAAENSIQAGERDIAFKFAGAPAFEFASSGDGYYSAGTVVTDSPDWDGVAYEDGGVSGAQYVVEYIGPAPAPQSSLALGAGSATVLRFVYRVTGRGASSQGSVRFAQTIFTEIE